MRDFRDKSRTPRFNRNAPHPPRRELAGAPAKPAAAPPPAREYRRADTNERDTHRPSGNDREIVYGVEPIRELVAAAPASIRVLYVKSGDERRFAAEIDLVRTGGGRVEFVDEAGLGAAGRIRRAPSGNRGPDARVRVRATRTDSRRAARSDRAGGRCHRSAQPGRADALGGRRRRQPRSSSRKTAPQASRPPRSSRRPAHGYI